MDMSVMHGADCSTDYWMLRVKLMIGTKRTYRRKCEVIGVRKSDLSKLQGRSEDGQSRETAMERYLRSIGERLKEAWDWTSCVELKCDILKTALCDGVKAEVGYENRKQPYWFRKNMADLKHLVEERNRLFALWLST